jgi:predicted nucleotidyltransferase
MSTELKKHLEILRNDFNRLRQDFHVKRIGVFGSFSNGTQKASSDIDILVEFDQPVSFFQFDDLENHLKHLLKRKIDLVTKKALKPRMKKSILNQAVYV